MGFSPAVATLAWALFRGHSCAGVKLLCSMPAQGGTTEAEAVVAGQQEVAGCPLALQSPLGCSKAPSPAAPPSDSPHTRTAGRQAAFAAAPFAAAAAPPHQLLHPRHPLALHRRQHALHFLSGRGACGGNRLLAVARAHTFGAMNRTARLPALAIKPERVRSQPKTFATPHTQHNSSQRPCSCRR